MKLRPGAWPNHALVVLETESLDGFSGPEYVEYREPDFGNAVTAIATTRKDGTEKLKLCPVS